MNIRLSDFVIEFLYKKKIKNIFTVSGGGSISLCDALAKSKINYICHHHEQAAAFAAESYARNTNQIGCALVTTGPGGTNALTGVASCWIDSVSAIFVSGQVFYDQTIRNTGLRQLGVQEIDIISLVKPITKYAKLIKNQDDIQYELEKAIYLSTKDRPGPVWIDIPADMQNAKINISKLRKFSPTSTENNFNSLNKKIIKIANLLQQSSRPLLHLGQGVKISQATNDALKLINKYKIPFALTWNSSDLINSDHPYYTGRPGAFAERGSNFIVQNCDLFISVGSRLPYMVTGYNSKDFARKAVRVTVDIDNSEVLKKNIDFQYRIKSDAKYFIKELFLNIKSMNIDKKWHSYCKNVRIKYPIVLDSFKKQKKYINSYFFIDTLSDILPNKTTIVTDMGLSFVGTHQAFKVKKDQKLYTNSGHAPMGWGLPASIGAAFSSQNQVVCITGDGGLQMNIQEFATIMRHKLNIKIFIYNNKGYLTIKQTQQLGFNGRLMGSDEESGLSFPNYQHIAKAHKIKFFQLKNHSNLKDNIKKIIKIKGPVICELIMDDEQEQMPKAINRRDKIGKSIPTTFEDMHPFLPKEELISNDFENFKLKDQK